MIKVTDKLAINIKGMSDTSSYPSLTIGTNRSTGEFKDLNELIDSYGGLQTLLDVSRALDDVLVILVDPEKYCTVLGDLYSRCYDGIIGHYMGPYVSCAYLTYRLERLRRSNTKDLERKIILDLRSTYSLESRYVENDISLAEYPIELHLLHYLTSDEINIDDILAERLRKILTVGIGWDFVGYRRDLCYDPILASEIFSVGFSLDRPEDVVKNLEDNALLSGAVHPRDLEWTWENFDHIRRIILKMDEGRNSHDELLRSLVLKGSPKHYTVSDLRDLLEIDLFRDTSQIFGRNEFRTNTNNAFINYIFKEYRSSMS